MIDRVSIDIGGEEFHAEVRHDLAPVTCAAFLAQLPWSGKLIHARWSGEACWIPLGAGDLGLPVESATSNPAPGEILLYPGGASQKEVLIPYAGSALHVAQARSRERPS